MTGYFATPEEFHKWVDDNYGPTSPRNYSVTHTPNEFHSEYETGASAGHTTGWVSWGGDPSTMRCVQISEDKNYDI